jgi:hypothetical protein
MVKVIRVKEVRGEVEEIARKIEGVLNRFQEIEFAYLFGSFLESNAFNDIDVALYISEDLSPYKGVRFALKMERELEKAIEPRYKFDVKILNHAPIAFQYEVIKAGNVLFSGDEVKRIRYEIQVLSSYLDYKETSDWLDKEFLAKV